MAIQATGAWRESEIMILGPLPWQFVQLLQLRLREYDFVLVYQCRKSRGRMPDGDSSRKLKSVAEGGHGVFISAVCDEVVGAEELGWERAGERGRA